MLSRRWSWPQHIPARRRGQPRGAWSGTCCYNCSLYDRDRPAAVRYHPVEAARDEGKMIFVGTSGYNYPEWKGTFYPDDLPTSKMLPYYPERFSTVEINYTFYRFPSEKALGGWVAATPEGFTFTLKAPRRITHDARLKQCEDLTQAFGNRARSLGGKLGVLFFQLPPSFKADTEVLDSFLDWVPPDIRVAMEFRHASWHSDEVFQRLRAANVALCIADSDRMTTPVEATADFGYLRLRDEGYQEDDIDSWADVIAAHSSGWKDVFVYFKHEEKGIGPEFARQMEASLHSRALRP